MDSPTHSGHLDFTIPSHPGKTSQTYYKIFGDLSTTKRPPLLLLHGGPGSNHDVLLGLSALSTGPVPIPTIFYDQIGGGDSTHFRDKGAEFYTFELFFAELENLLAHLQQRFGLKEFDLLGHSWGTVFATQWIVTRGEARIRELGLRRLICFSGLASMMQCSIVNRALFKSEASGEIFRKFEEAEAREDYTNDAYTDGVTFFFSKHRCRADPEPPEVGRSREKYVKDFTVRNALMGPSVFTPIGSLRDWDIRPELHRIKFPTLVLWGEFEESVISTPLSERIPDAQGMQLKGCSHLGWVEQPELCIRILVDFLKN